MRFSVDDMEVQKKAYSDSVLFQNQLIAPDG